MIEIGLCADEKFAMPCGVCVTSIFENNRANKIRIHILTEGFSEATIIRFEKTAAIYGQEIIIHKIDSSVFDGMPITEVYPKSIYFRLLFPKILQDSISKLIYLDCDTIVMQDIGDMWNIDVSSYGIGCVWDQKGEDIRHKNRIEITNTYLNSGVLLMNLEWLRKNDFTYKCMKYIGDYPERCVNPDQDAINVILKDKFLFIHPRYNMQQLYLLGKKELFLGCDKWNLINEAISSPVIIHYTGLFKPWHKECEHPMRNLFIETKNVSQWREYGISYRNNHYTRFKLFVMTKLRDVYRFCISTSK